jgi:hypothetical protein
MKRFVRGLVLVWIAGSLLVLPACEDDVVPTPVPLPPPPVRGVIAATSFTDFSVGVWLGIPIPLSQAGKLDFTVDWTFTNSDMTVAFGSQPCTFQQLDANACAFTIFTQGTTPKPRIFATQNLPVGNYFLYIYNLPFRSSTQTGTENVEAVALQIGLTVGAANSPGPIAPIRLSSQVIKP